MVAIQTGLFREWYGIYSFFGYIEQFRFVQSVRWDMKMENF